jgi:hypothetical protein
MEHPPIHVSPSRSLRLVFRPGGNGDGILEREDGAPILIPPPDYDRALDWLNQLNRLRDSSGKRISAIIQQDGFEPWWYSQDYLLRFLLVPLTQYLPLIELAASHDSISVMNAPADWKRLASALGAPFQFTASIKGGGKGRLILQVFSQAALFLFRVGRRDTVFYIVDQVSPGLREDFRFSPLYREMERRGYRYAEFAHTLSPRQALENTIRRRRPVFFLEALDPPAGDEDQTPITPPAGPMDTAQRALWMLVPHLLAGCKIAVARQTSLVRALRAQGARRAVIFDDNRHNHELIAACRTLNIPVLGFQHGVFNQFHAGLMAYGFEGARSHGFDRYGVWSDLFRDRLLRSSQLYKSEDLFISGPLRPPSFQPGARTLHAHTPIRVLVISEPLARKHEVAPFLQALQSDPRFLVCVKLRPGESAQSIKEYGLQVEAVQLLRTATVYEAFEQVDVAIGTYSTVLYEAALSLIPTIWLRTTRAYGRELVEEKLAEMADAPETLCDLVCRVAQLPEAERTRRRDRIWGAPIIAGAARLLDEAEQTLWKRP